MESEDIERARIKNCACLPVQHSGSRRNDKPPRPLLAAAAVYLLCVTDRFPVIRPLVVRHGCLRVGAVKGLRCADERLVLEWCQAGSEESWSSGTVVNNRRAKSSERQRSRASDQLLLPTPSSASQRASNGAFFLNGFFCLSDGDFVAAAENLQAIFERQCMCQRVRRGCMQSWQLQHAPLQQSERAAGARHNTSAHCEIAISRKGGSDMRASHLTRKHAERSTHHWQPLHVLRLPVELTHLPCRMCHSATLSR